MAGAQQVRASGVEGKANPSIFLRLNSD
jgi:hypothetical protein